MPVVVERMFSITIDDSSAWRVPSELTRDVDGRTFVKLRAYEPGLIRLICHDTVELKKERCSLHNVPGWRALLELRNEAAFPEEVAKAQPASASLFGADAKVPPKKPKARLRASQLQALRDSPSVLEFEIPGGVGPGLLVASLKPAHPGDDMWVLLDNDSIEQVIRYVRIHGVSLDSLTNRRVYSRSSSQGGWRMGSAGIVRKIQIGDPEEEPDAENCKKYRTVSGCKRQVVQAAPLADQSDDPLRDLLEAEQAAPLADQSDDPLGDSLPASLPSAPES